MGGWSDTWHDILQGGNPRWKITCDQSHAKALSHFERYVGKSTVDKPKSVFCPLAGDDPMVHRLWTKGYAVTSIDLVPAAVDVMKNQFTEGSWTKQTEHNNDDNEDGSSKTTIIWSHDSGRATLYVGDVLQSRPELHQKFDAVYDKDSFGALRKDMRRGYCQRISEYCKSGATIYMEVKLKDNHNDVKDVGPPFSLTRDDLMDEGSYGGGSGGSGGDFEYVEGLGSVYDISMGGMEQTGHVLRRR